MKRTVLRIMGPALGVILGWYTYGWVSNFTWASDTSQPNAAVAAPGASAETSAAATERTDEGQNAAREIAPDPGAPEQISWYGSVVLGAGGLFAAALVLGYLTLKYQGPPAPDPAAADHGHDDHGAGHDHDAHGHDSHGAPAAGHAGH